MPVCLSFSAGNQEDFDEAIPLRDRLSNLKGANLLGDRAYGPKKLRAYLTQRGAAFTIPPKKNLREPWEYDRKRDKRRSAVERFFCRLKDFRRIEPRYNKRPDSFRAFVLLAAAFVTFTSLCNLVDFSDTP